MLHRPGHPPRSLALLACAAVLVSASVAAADPPMPRGSRPDGTRVRSALGFRATVDHFDRLFQKDATPVRRIGPYHLAGVDVVRYLALAPAPPWRAVHVYRTSGVTWIFVVAAPLDAAQPTE